MATVGGWSPRAVHDLCSRRHVEGGATSPRTPGDRVRVVVDDTGLAAPRVVGGAR